MKPILFNTEMVRAILDGRKTQTRRVCKVSSRTMNIENKDCESVVYPSSNLCGICADFYDKKGFWRGAGKPIYLPGDILYVRETWGVLSRTYGTMPELFYRADGDAPGSIKWKPSIHMPKDAARIFLRVPDVKVERLQDIRDIDIYWEGVRMTDPGIISNSAKMREGFSKLWNSTVKKADLDRYGWDANPWVWVIKLERISKEEAEG